MTRKEELLAAFDEVWSHRWESFETTTKNIGEDEAFFQHEVYASSEKDPDMPVPGTIIWHLVHLAHCHKDYAQMIRIRPAETENIDPPSASSLEEAIANLFAFRKELRDVIVALPDEALEEKVSNGDTVARFVRMITRHDTWHTSQIAVARRLYRFRAK